MLCGDGEYRLRPCLVWQKETINTVSLYLDSVYNSYHLSTLFSLMNVYVLE